MDLCRRVEKSVPSKVVAKVWQEPVRTALQNKTADNNKAQTIKIPCSFSLEGGTFVWFWLRVVTAGTWLEENGALKNLTFSFS